jgi:hypothetical protein
MRRAAILPVIVLAVALMAPGGCGSSTKTNVDKFQGAQKDVAQTVVDLASTARKGDARKICDAYLTAELKARLAALARTSKRGTDCAAQLKDSIRDADAFDVTVESVQVAGTRAIVRVKTKTSAKRDPVDTLQMADQRGWRIAAL